VLPISLNLGTKRTEFPLKTNHFPGLKPYMKFPALKNSNKELTHQLNGYLLEFSALRATRREYNNQCSSILKQ